MPDHQRIKDRISQHSHQLSPNAVGKRLEWEEGKLLAFILSEIAEAERQAYASSMNDQHAEKLSETICQLTREVHELRLAITAHGSSGSNRCATKHDLDEMEKRIMARAQELVDAATALSTAADGLSVKTDKLVASAEKLITALANVSLPPAADAALAAMKASAAQAAAEGDKVDAEVAKVDGVLPTPAPAAPSTP